MTLWQSISNQSIENEEDLPSSIQQQLGELPGSDIATDESMI